MCFKLGLRTGNACQSIDVDETTFAVCVLCGYGGDISRLSCLKKKRQVDNPVRE